MTVPQADFIPKGLTQVPVEEPRDYTIVNLADTTDGTITRIRVSESMIRELTQQWIEIDDFRVKRCGNVVILELSEFKQKEKPKSKRWDYLEWLETRCGTAYVPRFQVIEAMNKIRDEIESPKDAVKGGRP